MNSILNNVITLRARDLGGRKLTIQGKFASGLPLVFCNSNQLLQVFVHLVNNAIEALEDAGGGTLTVTATQQNGDILIDFSDTGPGVREPQRVFDPFYTTKPVGQGIGLGLSTCYGILEEHGGTISCENRPGGGAMFLIRLPGRRS